MITPDTMMPTHDHFFVIPMTGAGGSIELFPEIFNAYLHDERCMGDCAPCGGMGGVPDTGPNGEMAVTCLTCGGSGKCPGCNAYLLFQARERGLLR